MSNNNGQRLAGKTAVITGGATGIGLASDEGSVNDIVLFFDSRLESRRPVVIISWYDNIINRIWPVFGFAPVELGKFNEGGALVRARGQTRGWLIFQDLFKKEQ